MADNVCHLCGDRFATMDEALDHLPVEHPDRCSDSITGIFADITPEDFTC